MKMKMKNLTNYVCLLFISLSTINAQDIPTNAELDKCYVKGIVKDEFNEVTETIEVQSAYEVLEIIPETYKIVNERVIIKEASKKFVYIPAIYETTDVTLDNDERQKLNIVPAGFRSVNKTVQIKPATSGWEYKTLENCLSTNKEDCVFARYVERPEVYRTINVQQLTSEAKIVKSKETEGYSSYRKLVVKTPAKYIEEEIPAIYKTIEKLVIDKPASTKSTTVPAKTETFQKTILTRKGGVTKWEEVECTLLEPTILPILYKLDSAILTSNSKKIIDEQLLPILTEKEISIEITAHTDSRGDENYNMLLSQKRANAVVNYLNSKGFFRNRVTAKGYGETQLKNRCANGVKCSESEHYKNRRIEFRVIGN